MFTTVNSYSGPQSPYDTHNPSSLVASYSPSALQSLIHFSSGARVLRWRFDLLTNTRGVNADGSPAFKSDLTPFVSKFVLTNDSTKAVQRSLQLDMVETAASQTVTISGGTITSAGIDYLNDVVSPVALIQKGPSEWIHCRLMVARFTRPGVKVPGYAVVRTATMPDLTSVVQESYAIDPTNLNGVPLTLPAGSKVIDCVRVLLTNAPTGVQTPGNLFSIPGCGLGDLLPSNAFSPGALASNTPGDWPTSTATLASDYQVSEGASYLDVINHLLKCINCYPLQADERGILRVQPLPTTTYAINPDVPVPDYTTRPAQWSYDSTLDSIISFGLTEDILIDSLANVVQVRVEDGNRTPYLATAINEDAGSPYNVTNWAGTGQARRLVKVVDEGQIPAIGASTGSGTVDGTDYAKQYAARELLLASWLTDEVQLPIAVNPLHCGYLDHDVIKLNVYQGNVAAGAAASIPVIALPSYPALISTELFLVDGYTITGTPATPGSGSNLVGNTGVTTDLEPREDKSGSTMTITAHRVTKTLNPANIKLQGAT